MEKDHKILAGAVLTGAAIGALVLFLNKEETQICISYDAIAYADYQYKSEINLPDFEIDEDKLSDPVDFAISELDRQLEDYIDGLQDWPNLDYKSLIDKANPAPRVTYLPPVIHWMNTWFPSSSLNPKLCATKVPEPGIVALLACGLLVFATSKK